jgi:hypothetical protein
MSDPGYCILSACYADPEHTCVVAQTAEAGSVAANERDRPVLWRRIHSTVPVAPYGAPLPALPPMQPVAELPLPPVLPAEPELPEPEPAPIPLPAALPPAPAEAHDPEWDNRERRRLAKEAVHAAATEAGRLTSEDQLLHELALMVVNENVEAMNDMKAAAAAAGLPVKEYAKRTIAIHHARRRRAGYIEAVKMQALKDIDTAAGDAIEAVAERAVRDIGGEE